MYGEKTSVSEHSESKGTFLPDRLAAFTDGVIAIAITILVLGLEAPSAREVPESKLGEFLRGALDPALGFVTSFILVGTYWMQHFAVFHYLRGANRQFVALNLLFLMCVSFLPFATGIQAAYRDDELAMLFYISFVSITGWSLLLLWHYAIHGRRLVDSDLPREIIAGISRRLLLAPVLALLACGVSLINIPLSRLVLLLIPILYFKQSATDAAWQGFKRG